MILVTLCLNEGGIDRHFTCKKKKQWLLGYWYSSAVRQDVLVITWIWAASTGKCKHVPKFHPTNTHVPNFNVQCSTLQINNYILGKCLCWPKLWVTCTCCCVVHACIFKNLDLTYGQPWTSIVINHTHTHTQLKYAQGQSKAYMYLYVALLCTPLWFLFYTKGKVPNICTKYLYTVDLQYSYSVDAHCSYECHANFSQLICNCSISRVTLVLVLHNSNYATTIFKAMMDASIIFFVKPGAQV